MMKSIWTVDGDATSWNAWAEAMAEVPISPLVRELIEENPAGQHAWALDLGCGTGRAFKPLAQAGYRVIGIDPSRYGIQLSRQRVVKEHLDAFPIQGSAAELPLQDGPVSLVLAMGVLFHLGPQELTLALDEIFRVLRRDGKAVLHFLDLEDWRHSLASEVPAAQIPEPGYRAVVTCFCPKETIESWITQAGLLIESMELKTSRNENGEQRNWIVRCKSSLLQPSRWSTGLGFAEGGEPAHHRCETV